ncbi:hypothetical protein vBPaePP1G_006 [Pseudomonas phage vB_PaeP_P1G]|uniref:Uncharacterized protein n=1 Tax=Pseudomonas phage vB_PaeP_P1G TaxID=3025372 RepID=A0AAE9YKC0_9CAUD|nr:hypothetical protein vBPaePP1G_006 [Pseudomonas phage vB_PaeP_P1G]
MPVSRINGWSADWASPRKSVVSGKGHRVGGWAASEQ